MPWTAVMQWLLLLFPAWLVWSSPRALNQQLEAEFQAQRERAYLELVREERRAALNKEMSANSHGARALSGAVSTKETITPQLPHTQPWHLWCSASCGSGSSTPCALILVLHGIYSNPSDMQWLTVGTGTAPAFDESPSYGGPFCAAYMKSLNAPWDYEGDGTDSNLIEAAIQHVETTRTLKQDSIHLHGFSSGSIMSGYLGCGRLGARIASMVQYAGSNKMNAACNWRQHIVVAHGTADDIVCYDFNNSFSRDAWGGCGGCGCTAAGCGCNGASASPGGQTDYQRGMARNPAYAGTGQRLAYHLAIANGYNPNNPEVPAPTSHLDLSTQTAGNETDVIHYARDDSAACGSVTLYRMNGQNHDYPNVRTGGYTGPSKFWLEIRKFFASHSRCAPSTSTTCTNRGGLSCNAPSVSNYQTTFFASGSAAKSAPACALECERSKGCIEATYSDTYKFCRLFGLPFVPQCSSWGAGWGQTSTYGCTAAAITTPLPTLVTTQLTAPVPTPVSTPMPTTTPTPTPTVAFCLPGQALSASTAAGWSCIVAGGASTGDSNFGYDKAKCDSDGGSWTVYNCQDAATYWSPSMAHSTLLAETWRQKCCSSNPLPVPISPAPAVAFCIAGQALSASTAAGWSCLVGGASKGDSNFGGFNKAACDALGGSWTEYNCQSAADYWSPSIDPFGALASAWRPTCCNSSAPMTLPTPGPGACPTQCRIPACTWLGTDGPGWNASWLRDEEGKPTINGSCTHYCKDSGSGKYLCGDGAWHRSGVDCTKCGRSESSTPTPASPSSSLCSTSGMSVHRAWGTGIKQCLNGPAPTSEAVCTVWQGMNGDSVNPGRTCRSFCTHFGLTCLNGYDDGDNGCVYGGAGIGCDSILGCCSSGGPTPDHVCSCGPSTTLNASTRTTGTPSAGTTTALISSSRNTTTTAAATTTTTASPPTVSVEVTVSMDSCSMVNKITSSKITSIGPAYKNASIHAMASQSPLFTVDTIEVTLTKVNCARRLFAESWRRLQSNVPGVLSAFVIITPPGTTLTQANKVKSSLQNASSFQSSLETALAENSLNINVTGVSALTVVVNNPAAGGTGPNEESSEGVLSFGALVGIITGSTICGVCCCCTAAYLYMRERLPSPSLTLPSTLGKPTRFLDTDTQIH